VLRVEQLHVSYGRTTALRGVSLEVAAGEMVCVVGANGAGKSTLLTTIAGLRRPNAGDIRLDGKSVAGRKPEEIADLGLTLVPEGRRIFQSLSVGENLAVPSTRRRRDLDEVLSLFPILADRLDMRAGNLSGGEQQQLAIARALIMRPRLMMVDEPSLGLAPLVVDRVYECFSRLRSDGVTLLIVEQSTARVLQVADRVYGLSTGSVALSGPVAEVSAERLEEAYFGRARVPQELLR
jgi:branched-chain amino acid transport system ATP-binding protein